MRISMREIFGSSCVIWIGCFFVLFFYLFTFKGFVPALRKDRIKFGIDLVGGTYITLGVQVEKAIEMELNDGLQSTLKRIAVDVAPVSQLIIGNQATLTCATVEEAQKLESILKREMRDVTVKKEGVLVRISFVDAAVQRIRQNAVEGNIEVLRSRLDNLGVGEIPIAAHGERNIIVELPDVDDPQKAKEMIGKPALLEIKLVEKVGRTPEEIMDAYDGEIPEGMIILPNKERDSEGNPLDYYLVPAFTDLTGRLLKTAYTGFGGTMDTEVVVNFEFKPEGGEKFYDLTRNNYRRRIAVILDGVVISAPNVNTPIRDKGYIHGNFTPESATELAALLRSGAFVAPVTFEEERHIGPSLGQESIRQGLMACLIGLLLLCVFSVVMYKLPGLFAVLALLYNLLLILYALSLLHATLTLPGIAGMVLTIGMAIDASILIYEKIKEELAGGVTLARAVQIGFSDALEVILDSNITTFIVGIVLYKFGAGPIQGFALTMMVGIIATLITGLFFLRSIFSLLVYNMHVKQLKI